MALGITWTTLAPWIAGAQGAGSPIPTDRPIGEVSTDSRSLQPGDLFVALRGERFDGHRFLAQVQAQGAIAAIVDHPQEDLDLPQWVVPHTLTAYQGLARGWRQYLGLPVVGITGSVGKTSTKEMIAAVLGTQGAVWKTEANNNNEIGVPKTLLQIRPEHRFAVVEMAMRGRGEIALLTDIVQPTIGVITNVGTAHIGRLGSEAAIAEAKCELLAHMPHHSTAILNHDNARLMATAPRFWSGKTITYGLGGGDLWGQWQGETLIVDQQTFPLPLPGRHQAENFLAALAVAQELGVDWQPLRQGLAVTLPQGRAQQHRLANDVILLDETYNAGFESMIAALDLLAHTPGKRRIAVLGTMKELGEAGERLHRQVGEKVQALGLAQLFILADEPVAEVMKTAAPQIAGQIFRDHGALITAIRQTLEPGDRILFKASHSVGLDRVVAALLPPNSP